ncbi:MAG: hypothetical protein KF889_09545 [Alphaproteobacteria bacterium]|nr:hypothetical protein [Alphaproteobacteria bacterium]MCW5741066.1 hypothetical protein [Alphaproteobacteria bacterium]
MPSFDRALAGLVRRALAIVSLALVAACSDYDVTTADRVLSLRDRDLTAAGPLRAVLRSTIDERIAALSLPLAAPGDHRLCGGELGNSRLRRGNREPIRSSAEAFTDSRFFLTFAGTPGGTLERQLFQASARHDFCYGHGAGTSGRTRQDCDLDMFADINRLCRASAEATRGAVNVTDDDNHYDVSIRSCRSRGFWMKAAVDVFGDTFYGDNFLNHCESDAGAQPPRDLVIAGRFVSAGQQLLEVRALTDLARLELVIHERDGAGGWRAAPPMTLDLSTIAVVEGETGDPLAYDESRFNPRYIERARACADNLGRPYRVTDLLRSVHFLSYAPVVADIDGSGRDWLVLVAVDVRRPPGATTDDPCGWGPIFLPIGFDRDAGGTIVPRATIALRPAGPNTRPGGIKYRFGSNIDRFEHRLHSAHGLLPVDRTAAGICAAGAQIVAPFIGTDSYNFQQIQVRVYEFCVEGRRIVRMRSHDWKAADEPEAAKRFWGTPDGGDFAHELYKRFQHPPRMLSVGAGQPALQFYFRSKCDGPRGYCSHRPDSDLFDLDNMLVQRLLPARRDRRRAERLAPDIRTTLDWHLFEGWPVHHQACLDSRTRVTGQAHKFGCHRGWDRTGYPAAIVADGAPRRPRDTTLLAIHLTNCRLGEAHMDSRGLCRERVPAAPQADTAPGDGHHERLRLSVIDTTLDSSPGPRLFDIDSPRLRSGEEHAAPRLAGSWRIHPPIAMSFGRDGAGLVMLRPSDPLDLRDHSPLSIEPGRQFQRDSATAQARPRVLRLLVIANPRPASDSTPWTAREYVCALPPELAGRRWPLRAAPVLRAERDAGAASLAIVARPLLAGGGPAIVVNEIDFAGAIPTRSALDGWTGPCAAAAEQDWEVRPVLGNAR